MSRPAPEPRGTDPEAIAVVDHLQALSAALMARGLCIRVNALQAAVTAMGPGRTQLVVLAIHDDRSMHWYWCWPDPTRASPAQYEYLARASDVLVAADSVADVLCPEPAGC